MRKIIYMSAMTGECTENHREACELFNKGHNIIIMVKVGDGDYTPATIWEHKAPFLENLDV